MKMMMEVRRGADADLVPFYTPSEGSKICGWIDDTVGGQNCALYLVPKPLAQIYLLRIASRGSKYFRITFAFSRSRMPDFRTAS